MPIGISWWRHIRCGCRLGRHGCRCNIWWILVKQWTWSNSDVICGRFVGQVVPDNQVKFGDPHFHLSREIPPEVFWGGIFDRSLNFDHCQPQVCSDVISGEVIDPTGVKVRVKFGDSRSYRSRDIRLPHFMRNDNDDGDDAGVRRSSHKGKLRRFA